MTKARTLADNYAADINQVTADAPLTGGGTSGTVTVGIQAGTTAQSGAVQLTDSTSSTSVTTAATPNSVKSAYDLANGAIAKTIVDAKADLITATAADTPTRLAVGTNGQYLKANSATSTGLEWADISAGGYTLLASGTLSGTAVSITSLSTDYRDLVFVMRDFYFNSDTSLYFRVNNTSSIYYSQRGSYEDIGVGGVGQSYFQMSGAAYDSRDANNFAYWRIFDYANTSSMKMGTSYTVFGNSSGSGFNVLFANSVINTTSAITQLNVETDSLAYTFSGGTYAVYGVK